MATLQFKGKNIIWNHHMSVPYHTLDLDEKLSYKQDKADGNLIVEGDNLPALKSLLPQYTGKIDCIYIDPPYNTGNEGWVYNDNVNSPLVKEWIGKEVGSDDLTRHDKWLSMLTPRLKLLKDLLSEDGLIFVSIDDNEVHHMRMLMDEIFGEDNFINLLVWQRNTSGKTVSRELANNVEFILLYSRTEKYNLNPVYKPLAESTRRMYSKDDNDGRGPYRLYPLQKTGQPGPQTTYDYVDNTGKVWKCPKKGWRMIQEKLKKLENDNRLFLEAGKLSEKAYWNERTSEGKVADSLWNDLPENSVGTKEITELLGNDNVFNNPKPTDLIKRCLKMQDKEALVLDAFAGSGTTAQAVLELNEEDEGNRKFILIQMPENSEKEPKKNIARDITRERVVKVIEKKLKNKDIGFEYRRVGQPIDAETILSGQLPTYKQLAKYVYYLATGQSPKDKDIDEKKFLAGKVDHTEVYLLYTPDMDELKKMAITFEWAKEISKGKDNKKIVYAPACFMDDEYLEQFNIKFVSIPYNLFEREQ